MGNAQNPPCADYVCRCEDVSRSLFSFRAGVRQPALVHSRKGFTNPSFEIVFLLHSACNFHVIYSFQTDVRNFYRLVTLVMFECALCLCLVDDEIKVMKGKANLNSDTRYLISSVISA